MWEILADKWYQYDDAKEKRLRQATLLLKEKFGKKAMLKGMNLQEGATTILRNQQIGGHASGETKLPVKKGTTAA